MPIRQHSAILLGQGLVKAGKVSRQFEYFPGDSAALMRRPVRIATGGRNLPNTYLAKFFIDLDLARFQNPAALDWNFPSQKSWQFSDSPSLVTPASA